MALTPEQVLNKHFQTTQFRRGYEERDVDDFLDEIVAEMRSLIEQRDDYLKQLNDCRASKNQSAVRADGATAAGRPDVSEQGSHLDTGHRKESGSPRVSRSAVSRRGPRTPAASRTRTRRPRVAQLRICRAVSSRP